MDVNALSGVGGFLQGLNSVLIPHLEQQSKISAAKKLQEDQNLRKAVADRVKKNPSLLKNPKFVGAYRDIMGLGEGKSTPEDLNLLLTTPSEEEKYSEQGRQFATGVMSDVMGDGGAPSNPQPMLAQLGNQAQPGSAQNQISTITEGMTPASDVSTLPMAAPPAQPQAPTGDFIPAGYEGAGPLHSPTEPLAGTSTAPQETILAPSGGRPTNRFELKREQGIGLTIRLPGGLSMNMPGYTPKQQEFVQLKRAFQAVRAGKATLDEATAGLSPDGVRAVQEGVGTDHLNNLLQNGVALDAAVTDTARKYGITALPKSVQAMITGPPTAAANESARRGAGLPFVSQEEAARQQEQLRVAGPKAFESASGRFAAELKYKPDEVQRAIQALRIDPENPQPDDAGKIDAYLMGKGVKKVGAEEGARQEINPQSGYLANKATAERVGQTTPPATEVMKTQVTQQADIVAGKERAKNEADLDKPIPNPLQYIEPKTEQPFPPNTTIHQARAQGAIILNEKQSERLQQMKQVENFLSSFETVAKDLLSSDNPFINWKNIQVARASSDPRLTELRSFEPDFTTLSRFTGERGQTTQKDIERAYRALAYGEGKAFGFVRRSGLERALKQARRRIGATRKSLGFNETVGALAPGTKAQFGDITVERVQ